MSKKQPVVLAKRRKQIQRKEDKICLDRVLGLTCTNGNSLAFITAANCVIYPAGKPISCVCSSPDDKLIAYGECGHSPCVHVWDVSTSSPNRVAALQGHKFGISCLCFSPNLRYLISVGYQHDQTINIWDWKQGTKIASNKITSKVYGIAYSEDGRYFVTVGSRRVRYWYFDTGQRSKATKLTLPLNGRSAILGEHQNNCFVAVKCGKGQLAKFTYVLTKSGLLCQFNQSRELEKFTDIKSGKASCLEIHSDYVMCGCNDGIIRLFDPITLDYITTAPRPHSLGVSLLSTLHLTEFISTPGHCPDTVALSYDIINNKLIVAYNDHSLYMWDLTNIDTIGKSHSFLYHNACVWDIAVYPLVSEVNDNGGLLPPLSFATCSSDNTIRFWNLTTPSDDGNGMKQRMKNVYSKEILNILYGDSSDGSCLRDLSQAPGDSSAVADNTRGIRSIQFSRHGNHIAVGDRAGNLRVYDLQFMDKIVDIMAHDAEILSLKYSSVPSCGDACVFLATGSRDRLIHIFDVSNNYNHHSTIDDHSGSITAVGFSTTSEGVLHLYSCGADKSLMFHLFDGSVFKRTIHVAEKATMYDMVIDPMNKFIATASQDKLLRVYSLITGKLRLSYKACDDDNTAGLLKVAIDPSGTFAAVSAADKTVYVIDIFSGEFFAKLNGHSEVITALQFSLDCQYLYTTSGDSCIFIWKLSSVMVESMRRRLLDLGQNFYSPSASHDQKRETYIIPSTTSSTNSTTTTTTTTTDGIDIFRFSVSKIPSWAQKQIKVSSDDINKEMDRPDGHVHQSMGRWAETISDTTDLRHYEGTSESSPDLGSETSDVEIIEGLNVEMTNELFQENQLEGFADEVMKSIDDQNKERNEEAVAALTDEGIDREEIFDEEEEEEEANMENNEKIEEVVYPKLTGRSSVDPSMFKVSTPERRQSNDYISQRSVDEDEDDDSCCSTPDSPETPQGTTGELVIDDSAFLRAHFESLTVEKADVLFKPTWSDEEGDEGGGPFSSLSPQRPSISMLYFNKSCTTGYIKAKTAVLSLTPPPSCPAEISPVNTDVLESPRLLLVSPDPDGRDLHPTTTTTTTASVDKSDNNNNDDDDIKSCDSHMISDDKEILRPRPHVSTDTKSIRSKITEEEITKVRKRLEELGYSQHLISAKSRTELTDDDIEDNHDSVGVNSGDDDNIHDDDDDVIDDVIVNDDIIQSNESLLSKVDTIESSMEDLISDLSSVIEKSNELSAADKAKFNQHSSQMISNIRMRIHHLNSTLSSTSSSVPVATESSLPSSSQPSLDPHIQTLLEHYSDKLVELVRKKIIDS